MANDPTIVLPKEALEVALDSVIDILGESGVNAIINQAGLTHLYQDGEIPSHQKPSFGEIGQVTSTLFDIYGVRGGTAILKRTGRIQFQKWAEAYPKPLNAAKLAFKAMSPFNRINTTLNVVKVAAKHIVGVETDIKEKDGVLYFAAMQCPYCADMQAEHLYCHTAVGALEAVAKWATSEQWQVNEISCMANGKAACVFEIKPPA